MDIYSFGFDFNRFARKTAVTGCCIITFATAPLEFKKHHQPNDDIAHQTEYMLQTGQQSIYNISGSYQFGFNGDYHNISL